MFNAGSSDIKGLEVSVEKDFGEQLTLNAGASVTDGRYKDFVTNNRSGDIVDVGAPRTMGLVLRYDM